jgi:soluble lytic murein transglycosylase
MGAALVLSGTLWTWFRPVLHKPLINKYAGAYKFDPLWVMAIIKVESGFAPGAHSKRGALGLMQLLPSTARDLAPEIGLARLEERDLKDPNINLHLGFYYLAKLQQEFPDDEVAVLAAYNAGPGIAQLWRKGKPSLDLSDIPYPETRQFVERVQRTYAMLKWLQRWKHTLGMD